MPKIMLVEDDKNLITIYADRLRAEGHEIVTARDGEEALATAVKEKPDLIVSDVMMPKISGFDMLDILRSTPETKETKVIMMTALSQTEDKDRADRLGANKYLVKSQVTLDDVARVVNEVLAQDGATVEPPVQEPALVVSSTAAPSLPVDPAPVIATASPVTTTAAVVETPVSAAAPVVAEEQMSTTAATVSVVDSSAVPPESQSTTSAANSPATALATSSDNSPSQDAPNADAPEVQMGTQALPADPVSSSSDTQSDMQKVAVTDTEPTPLSLPSNDIVTSAPSTEEETREIQDEIESFIAGTLPDTPVHQEPTLPASVHVTPSPAATTPEPMNQPATQSDPATTTVEPPVQEPALVVSSTAAPSLPVDPAPVIATASPVTTTAAVVETPVSAAAPSTPIMQNGVIKPLVAPATKPSIHELYEKEIAKESANATVAPHPAGTVLTPKEIETSAAPSTTSQLSSSSQAAQSPDPNDPTSIAL